MLDTVYKIIEENDVVVEGVGVEGSRNLEKSITVRRNSYFEKNKIHVGNLGTGEEVIGEKRNFLEVWFGDFGDLKAFCLIMDKKF